MAYVVAYRRSGRPLYASVGYTSSETLKYARRFPTRQSAHTELMERREVADNGRTWLKFVRGGSYQRSGRGKYGRY